MIKVVVVGAGKRAQHLLPYIDEELGFQRAAVVEPNPERRRQAVERFGFPAAFAAWEEFAASGIGADCAMVLTPPYLHVEPFCRAAELGLHIFCEKPIGMTLPQADAILAAARNSKGKTFFGYNRRYMPVGRLARALRAGEPPRFVHVSKSRPMRYSRMLAENAVHAVELLLCLSLSRPRHVRAVGRFARPEIESESFISAVVEFESGGGGSIQMVTHGAGVVERVEVYGEDYTLLGSFPDEIWYRGDPKRLEEAARKAGLELVPLEGDGHYRIACEDKSGVREEIRAFRAWIDDRDGALKGDVPDVEAAHAAQALVEAIYNDCGLVNEGRAERWVSES